MKTKDFIGKFNEAEVIQRMISVKTPEEAYAVAKEYGVTDSMEEFVEEMTKFKTAIDELSEEDLEAVAGGLSPEVAISLATAATAASAVTTVTATAASLAVTALTGATAVSATVSAAVSATGTLVSTLASSAI